MDKLRAIELFVQLSETGSFTQLAEELGASKSMISKEISKLEDQLGARLLHRSTRHLQLTEIGEAYLLRCRDILSAMHDADHFVQDFNEAPKGRLKINAPMALGISDLARLFSDFMQRYPNIELDIHLSDEPTDLIQEGFDIGFRASSTAFDSNYVGKPLTEFRYHICVSADYFEHNPKIKRAADLLQHNCFIYRYFRGKSHWPIGDGVNVGGNLRVNSTPFMMEFIRKGLGVGFIPEFVCRDDLACGRVIEVLPRSPKPPLTLYALYPARHHVPLKLKHCIAFFEEWFQHNGH